MFKQMEIFQKLYELSSIELFWLGIGLAGQGLFFGRFLIQWIASEKKGRSHIPISFWYLSLGGSFLLLSYSIYRQDPIFIVGFSINNIIYFRNLTLIKKEKNS